MNDLNYLWPIFPYALGILTVMQWNKLREEKRANSGGEIQRIIKLKS